MLKSTLLTTALVALPFAASAQEAATFDWNGAYVGVFAGNDRVKDTFSPQVDDYSYDGAFLNGFEAIASGNGLAAGVQLGYRYQMGNIVLGASLDYSHSKAAGEEVLYNGYADYDYGGAVELKSVASLRASFGYAVGNTLFYVNAGPARASVNQTVIDDYEFDPQSWNSTLNGYTAGVGISHAINDHLVLDTEVNMMKLSRDNYSVYDGYNYKSDVSSSQVRVGLSYKF